ncbi:hypothetical protein LUZ60_009703 [Juncus effusus]|nr:hypothetical protein LUZ60_009703 [Juncus effusus]
MSNNSSIVSPSTSPDTSTATSSSSLQEIFISFAALSLLFIALFSFRCFVQQRAVRRALLLQKQPINGGLNSTAISSLPSFTYKRSENDGLSMECSICLSSVEEGEIVRVLPKCKHSFHGNCVELWLQGHKTCPVCRMEVLREDRE